MAVTNFSGLTINSAQTGIQFTKVTDSSADWSSVSDSTYFYDKADKLVHYKDSTGTVQELFSSGGSITVGTTPSTGVNTRVFFQACGVVQQDTNFTFDSTLKRLTLKAVGAYQSELEAGETQSLETAHKYAKIAYEQMGYEVIIDIL